MNGRNRTVSNVLESTIYQMKSNAIDGSLGMPSATLELRMGLVKQNCFGNSKYFGSLRLVTGLDHSRH